MSATSSNAQLVLRSEKIGPEHLDRLAVVYVRQSTNQQVLNHQESTRLQYGLKSRAVALGWPEARVLVIDDDLGHSGSSIEDRVGFQRLVSEVSLNHVGIILGVEMSRLARSCKDWHHLLEVCALFGTLIADLDGVYAPGDYNDRLLLGLKGTMSEAELHILKQRMYQGKLQKARRGELGTPLPIGYVRRPSGEVRFDPDEQVQHVVRMIFQKFEELGTLHALLRYLVQHDIRLGVRVRSGPNKGDLEWRRPNRQTLQNMLHNPFYAGAYAYGRRAVDPRRKKPGRPATGRTVKTASDCAVLIQDHHPAYISWDQYERHLERLAANRSHVAARGAIRTGYALLAGLLICGHCGCRVTVRYKRGAGGVTYICCRQLTDYGADLCQQMAGKPLDEFVSRQVLAALAPAALELSLRAAEHLEHDRAELDRLWQQRMERAAFEADRAGRHVRAVEPENRLVARQLEREWEEKLTALQVLKEDYRRFTQAQPRVLSAEERQAVQRLAEDIPALWSAPSTTVADRKAIIRQVIDRIVVATEGKTERVQVTIEWAGGLKTKAHVKRPVQKLSQLSDYPQLCDRVRALAAEGLSAPAIARQLNQEGFKPPKHHEQFGRQGVLGLMTRLGLTSRRDRTTRRPRLRRNEWLLPELARRLDMPAATLYSWIRKGWLTAREDPGPPRRLVALAGPADLKVLQERRDRPPGYSTRRQFLDWENRQELELSREGD